MAVSQSPEEIESLSEGLVCEYLKRRGLIRTLETFNIEVSQDKRDENDLSSQLWLELRQRLRLNEFIRNNAALLHNGQPPTTLEMLLHLSNNAFHEAPQRGLQPEPYELPNMPEDVILDHNPPPSPVLKGPISPTKKKKKKKKKKSKRRQFHMRDIRPNVPAYQGPDMATFYPGVQIQEKSRESWIPETTRMRWLKRDMEMAKYNQKRIDDHERTKEKKAYKTSEHQRMKVKAKLMRRSKNRSKCALCEHDFLDLPLNISYKAVMDLRAQWGVEPQPHAMFRGLQRFPHWYTICKVCIYCKQFFNKTFLNPASRGKPLTETEGTGMSPNKGTK